MILEAHKFVMRNSVTKNGCKRFLKSINEDFCTILVYLISMSHQVNGYIWKPKKRTGAGGRLTAKRLYEELFYPAESIGIIKPTSGRCARVIRVGVCGCGVNRWSIKGIFPLFPISNYEKSRCADPQYGVKRSQRIVKKCYEHFQFHNSGI